VAAAAAAVEVHLISSPAARAQQTAEALHVPVKTVKEHRARRCGVGDHQGGGLARPQGQRGAGGTPARPRHAAAFLVSGAQTEVSIKKGGLWWLNDRAREDGAKIVVTGGRVT
jgi:phosphohistidine phosphatase